jgi:hypothetical protein
MEYTTEFNEETGICTVTVKGQVNRPDDSYELQNFSREFDKSNNCKRFLFDMRNADIIGEPGDSVLIGMSPEDNESLQRHHVVASVYADNKSEHKLIQTVARVRGYEFRVFTQIDQAYDWLKSVQLN